jgi:hypothetical protein
MVIRDKTVFAEILKRERDKQALAAIKIIFK